MQLSSGKKKRGLNRTATAKKRLQRGSVAQSQVFERRPDMSSNPAIYESDMKPHERAFSTSNFMESQLESAYEEIKEVRTAQKEKNGLCSKKHRMLTMKTSHNQ